MDSGVNDTVKDGVPGGSHTMARRAAGTASLSTSLAVNPTAAASGPLGSRVYSAVRGGEGCRCRV